MSIEGLAHESDPSEDFESALTTFGHTIQELDALVVAREGAMSTDEEEALQALSAKILNLYDATTV